MKQNFTALGAYIFAGGFTVGVSKHFKVLAHFEQGPYGTETAKTNFPSLPIHMDPATWPVKDYKGKVDFVYSNPPCAAWSAAGVSSASKWETDGRVNCARTSFDLVEQLRPKVWCWESVARAYTLGRPLVDQFTQRALDLGYSVTHLLVDAKKLGTPQRRNRFFMIVHNVALPFVEPNFPKITAGMALKGVAKEPGAKVNPTKAWVKLLPQLKAGQEMRRLFNAKFPKVVAGFKEGEPVLGRPSFQVRRIPLDDVSFTLTGGACLIHPTEHRYISVPESAALCGYPKNFVFKGNLGQQYAQVAQAVMPPVGAWLAGIVKQGLQKNLPDKGRVSLVDLRGERGIFFQLGVKGQYKSQEVRDAEPKVPRLPRGPKPRLGSPGPIQPKPPRQPREPEQVPTLKPSQVIKCTEGQSGKFIRRLIRTTKLTDLEIVAQVLANFPGRKTSTKDVAWNKAQMKKGVE